MANSIAFFPWVTIDEALSVGPLRLIPYERGKLPGNREHVSQSDIDGVLRGYALRKTQLVRLATLVEFGDWQLGQEADAQRRSKLFRIRELVAFAALAHRRLFHGHFDYCNFDTYAFVVQHYEPNNPGAFVFPTRRRDSVTRHHWNASQFAFLKPLHVAAHPQVKLEVAFLEALLHADEAGDLAYEAIVEFNRANTDSQDVSTHTELVLTKSAFEYLFGIGHSSKEFLDALLPMISPRSAGGAPQGPLKLRWENARPRAARPLEAWAREFCDMRGGAAHGKQRGGARFVWSADAHLAFASILFPLLVKQMLSVQRGCSYAFSERDAVELANIEAYIMQDPFATQPEIYSEGDHPWNRVYGAVLSEVMRRGLLREMDKVDWANLPKE